MNKISAPLHSGDYPNRPIDCLLAIDPLFSRISELAETAGWSKKEVAVSLVQLAGANLRRALSSLEVAADAGADKEFDEMRDELL